VKEYKVKTVVPSLSSVVYLSQLNNKDLIVINKYISSNDDQGLANYFEDLLKDYNYKTNLDKFFALLNLRMTCVSNELKIKSNVGTVPMTFKIVIRNILLKLIENGEFNLKNFRSEGLEIVFKSPSTLFFKDYIDFLYQVIESIKIENKETFNGLNKGDRYKIILSLKKEVLNEIKSHIRDNQQTFNMINLEVDNLSIKKDITFLDNSSFFFLKFVFKNNISNLYSKMYSVCKTMNMSLNDYYNLTPAETDVFIALYKKSNSIK